MQAPAAPTAPIGDAKSSANPTPEVPPSYASHYQPGPPGSLVYPASGYPGPAGFPMYHQGGGQPVVYQPGMYMNPNPSAAIPWMPVLPPLPNCPPGLEYLSQLDKILVHQETDILELMTRFESNNRYQVKNSSGQMVFLVLEDTDDVTRNAYRSLRPFVLRVTDCTGREVMRIQRPFKCCSCCCFCCSCALQEVEVQSPPGVPLGYIMEHWKCYKTNFSIENEKKEHILDLDGPRLPNCCSDTVFPIYSLDGVTIGNICRQWPGLLRVSVADIDNYEITFPLDLNVKMKAMIFAACFLIDFMFFESSPQDDRHHHRNH